VEFALAVWQPQSPTDFRFLRKHDHISTVYTKFIATHLHTLLVANNFFPCRSFSKRPGIPSIHL